MMKIIYKEGETKITGSKQNKNTEIIIVSNIIRRKKGLAKHSRYYKRDNKKKQDKGEREKDN